MSTILKILVLLVTILSATQNYGGTSLAAESYPSKPVTILVPYSPGGVSDMVARIFADVGRKYFSQPLVVENRIGASGTKAIYDLVTSTPDGYTTCLASSGEAAAALHLVPANFNLDSFTIIAHVGNQPVTVATSGPWNSLREIIDYGKKNPGKLRAGVSGLGGVTRVVGDMWAMKAGIEIKIVPFQGSGPLVPAVLGKHVEIGFLNVPETTTHYKAQTMKVLCVFAETRSKALPQVPTAKELGYDVAGGSTHFVIVPNGTPQEVRGKLNELVKKVEDDPEFQQKTIELGYSAAYKDAETSKAFLKEWYDTAGKMFDILGLKKR